MPVLPAAQQPQFGRSVPTARAQYILKEVNALSKSDRAMYNKYYNKRLCWPSFRLTRHMQQQIAAASSDGNPAHKEQKLCQILTATMRFAEPTIVVYKEATKPKKDCLLVRPSEASKIETANQAFVTANKKGPDKSQILRIVEDPGGTNPQFAQVVFNKAKRESSDLSSATNKKSLHGATLSSILFSQRKVTAHGSAVHRDSEIHDTGLGALQNRSPHEVEEPAVDVSCLIKSMAPKTWDGRSLTVLHSSEKSMSNPSDVLANLKVACEEFITRATRLVHDIEASRRQEIGELLNRGAEINFIITPTRAFSARKMTMNENAVEGEKNCMVDLFTTKRKFASYMVSTEPGLQPKEGTPGTSTEHESSLDSDNTKSKQPKTDNH